MSSSGATPAAPSIAFQRPVARGRDQVAASESVAFPEVVWAHYLRQKELHDEHQLHGPAEDEFRSQLDRFVEEEGPIINAYWCTKEASAVAITEKEGDKRPRAQVHVAPPAQHPLPRGDRLGDARRAGDRPCAAHHRDPGDPRQRGPLGNGRADRNAMAALDRRLPAEHRRRSGEEDQSPGNDQSGESRARRAGPGRVLLRPRGREDGAARLLLGHADRDPHAGAARCPGAPSRTRSSGTTPSRARRRGPSSSAT